MSIANGTVYRVDTRTLEMILVHRGETKRDLAREIGVSESSLYRSFKDQKLSYVVIARIIDYLGIPNDDIGTIFFAK